MPFPILTPEWRPYIVAIVVVFSLSSMSIAAKLGKDRASPGTYSGFLCSYTAIMAATALLGATVLDVPAVLPPTLVATATYAAAGIAAAIVALALNLMIVRGTAKIPRLAIRWPGGTDQRSEQIVRAGLLTAVAILEELLFRGYIVTIAFWLPDRASAAAALVLSVLCFGAAHIYGGVAEAAGKLPLGILTMALTIGSGLLWPAIVAHVCFNLMSSGSPVAQRRIA